LRCQQISGRASPTIDDIDISSDDSSGGSLDNVEYVNDVDDVDDSTANYNPYEASHETFESSLPAPSVHLSERDDMSIHDEDGIMRNYKSNEASNIEMEEETQFF
jgi:hypothetical protein